MPRMSEAEKQKSHKRILNAASQLFRERGIEATSVSDVMKAAGLTHGVSRVKNRTSMMKKRLLPQPSTRLWTTY